MATALRYVRTVGERCSRTQCGVPAAARVTFDALSCFVWIDPFDDGGPLDVGARGAGVLCTRHADTLVPPRGWAVQDRRGPEPRLWSDRPPCPIEPAVLEVVPTRHLAGSERLAGSSSVLTQPLPFDASEPVVLSDADAESDIDRLLDSPAGPLLARAFNAAHRRPAGAPFSHRPG